MRRSAAAPGGRGLAPLLAALLLATACDRRLSHLIALVATGDSRVATISFTKRKKKGLACTVEQHGGGSEPMLRAVRRYRTFYVASANDTWFSTQLICAGKPGNLRLRQLPERRFFFSFLKSTSSETTDLLSAHVLPPIRVGNPNPNPMGILDP